MASLNNFESFSTRRESFWNTGHSDFGSINVSDLGEGAKLHSLAAFEKDPAFAQVFEYPEENYVEDALEQYKPPDIPFHQHLRPEDTLSNYTCDSSMFSHDSASTAATALSVDSWSAWSVGSANSQDVAMPFSKSSLVSDPPDVFVVAPTASQERTGAVASSSTRRSGGKTRSSIHTGLHTCQWLGCSKGYKDKGSLKTHVDRDHFGKKAFIYTGSWRRDVKYDTLWRHVTKTDGFSTPQYRKYIINAHKKWYREVLPRGERPMRRSLTSYPLPPEVALIASCFL